MSPRTKATTATLPEKKVSKLAFGFERARNTSTPIVEVETPDPSASMAVMIETAQALAVKHKDAEPPMIKWDVVTGLMGINTPGVQALKTALAGNPSKGWAAVQHPSTLIPHTALDIAQRLTEGTILFFQNAHRFVDVTPVMQAIWNCRDPFKTDGRMLVLLGAFFRTPQELRGDVIRLTEELPTREALRELVKLQFDNAELQPPTEEVLRAAVDALIGLSMFTAEQVTAMALMKDGLNFDILWEHKIKAVESNPGMKVFKNPDKLSGLEYLKGQDNIRDYGYQLIAADAFGVIAFIDEGEKALAGGLADFAGDSGVAKDQVGVLLSFQQDHDCRGVMAAGISGTGKTEWAKALAATSGKPMIMLDMGGMKGGTVGESEGRIRNAMTVLAAIAGGPGRILFVMTANKTVQFTPEINRRYKKRFFFDHPDKAGRTQLWQVYLTRYGITPEQQDLPPGFDEGWTGDEIKNVCLDAKTFKQTLHEAARFLVPSAASDAVAHQALREAADKKFLSAAKPGWYNAPSEAERPNVDEGAFLKAAMLTAGQRKLTVN